MPAIAGLLVGMLLWPGPGPAAPPQGSVSKPSILLVTIDTLRADRVGCYGYRLAETPHLDRLSAEGVRFEEARTHVPLTLPAHASILTGLLPPRHRVRGNGLFRLPSDVRTLATVLKSAGYSTAAVVSSVVLDRAYGLDRGFDLYDDNQRVGEKTAFNYIERGAGQVAESAIGSLRTLESPFFLWVHLYDPHMHWIPPEPFRSRHPGRLYDAEIAFSDAALGQVWAAAAARAGGKLIVAATSDHGESLGEHGENQHGYTLHRGVLRVPLILAGPGLPRGTQVADTIGLIDLAPTLAELAGVSIPGADGRSLRRSWSVAETAAGRATSRAPEAEHPPLWEESLHPLYDSGWAPLRGLLTSRWHFVEAPRPELYDRLEDPADRTDVANRHRETVEELRADLARIGASMGDATEPAPTVDDSPEEQERRARLASLGYLTSGGGAPAGPAGASAAARLDPKEGLPGFLAVEKAADLVELGQGKEARALLEPHLKKDPGNPRLWHQIGEAMMAMGDSGPAEEALRKAIALDPRSEFIRYSLAALLGSKGDTHGQKGQLERILAANPRAVDASLGLAALAVMRGDIAGSEAILRASYAAGGRDPDLLDRLGHHMLRKGMRREAAQYFEEALALRPADATALLESGRAALRAGDPGKAIELLTKCATGQEAIECRMELARAYVLGPRDLVSARRELLSARELAGDEKTRTEVDARLKALEKMKDPKEYQ